MPSEPFPWDRRDFRKHERSASDPRFAAGGFGGLNRRREQPQHPTAPPPFQQQRWFSDFRSSPRLVPHAEGHSKQGGWPVYSDDSGQGFVPLGSRYADRNLEDENRRPFVSRGNGRNMRNNRENRKPIIRNNVWKAPTWEPAKSPSLPAKPIADVSNLMSVQNTQCSSKENTFASQVPPNSVNLSEQSQSHPLTEEDEMTGVGTESGKESSGARYADRNLEDQNSRPFVSRGDERYIRNNRKNRNPFTRNKVWKAPTWQPAKSPSAPAKPIADVSNLMSVQNTQQCSSKGITFASQVPPDSANLSEQPQPPPPPPPPPQPQPQPLMKEDEVTEAGLESGKENCVVSVDWKPLKFARMGGMSSRGSSKSVGVGSPNIVAEMKPKNETLVQSPTDDACVRRSASPVLSNETESIRKRRLGWGEGLAKYEKKRVEGPEDGVSNTESMNPSEKSPRVASLSDCASPGTPHSVAYNSSPVTEEKRRVKEADCSPSVAPKIHYDAPSFNLQNLDLASIANLSLSINELLHPTSAETGYGRTTSMNKLLVWKVDMLKALEMTECEIESLETELKSLVAEPGSFCSVGFSSLPGDKQLKPCEEVVTASKCGINLIPLQIDSSEELMATNATVGLKDEDIYSPGSAISRFAELQPVISPSETAEVAKGSMNLNVESSRNMDDKCLKNGLSYEENSADVDTETTLDDLAGVSNVNYRVDNAYDSILSSNRDAARKCMEQLNKFLPEHPHLKSSIESSISSLQSDPSVVKTKILMRKQFLRFKEKVLTIKFKAFRHFWKEDRLVSIKKLRGKTRKKFDPSRSSYKRNHSSLHARVSSHAKGPRTVPADEVIELVNGLLSESAFKPHERTLKMPAMILDKEVKMSRFISNNGLVEDPCSVERERSMLNPWTSEEKEMFIDKLAAYGKDFGKIASFLDRRSVADCIEFYYKNHKSKFFEKIKKNPGSSNQIKSPSKTYLVASGKRRNPEINASSLDILGAASEIVANIDNGINSQLKLPPISSDSTNTDSDERETEAADVLASICGSLSSEGVSSCITSSVDKPGDGYPDHEPTQRGLTPDDDDEMSDVSCGEVDPTDWSDEEKSIFVQAVSLYGNDFVMVSECVRTRSVGECKLFYSKARKCLDLDQIQAGGETGTALVDDNGGGSDIEDGCTVETGSVIRNNSSECSMEENLLEPDMKLNHQSEVVGPQNMRPDFETSKGSNGLIAKDSSEQGVKEEDDRCIIDEAENKGIVEESGPSLTEGNPDNKTVEDISSAVNVPESLTNVSRPSTGDCQQNHPEHSSSDSIVSSQILWGYPVSVQSAKERIGDVKCEKPTALPDVRIQSRNWTSDCDTELFLKKCNGSRQVEGPLPSLGRRSRDHSRPQSSCSSAGEGTSTNGDVKLFGTILNSSQHKTNNFVQRTDGNNRQGHKITRESLTLNLGAHHVANPDAVQSKFEHQTAILDSVQSKFDRKTYVGKTEHIPGGSLGFWDGNRLQMGIPRLPDSALLLAKYPAAFTNYGKQDQTPLHGTLTSSVLQATVNNSVFQATVDSSVFQASSSNMPRYPELQPFTIGVNQRQETAFNEVRRINSFDLVPGRPNVVGRGGGFVGGQSLSLSDPVTAMKMQYMEQLRLKGGDLIKEVDRWISSRGGR